MKIEQLLVQHLYDSKQVTLQGIGSFRLAGDFVLPSDNDKDFVIPDNALSFEYSSRAEEDNALVDFIVQQTRKIRPLASADLDSYVTLGKQFLNIGKPFRIEGVGTLQKSMNGEYKFTPGQFITPKLQDVPRPLKEKFEEGDISFNTNGERPGSSKKLLLIIAALVGLGLLGWGAWYLLHRKKTVDTVKTETPPKKDTTNKTLAPNPADTGQTATNNPIINPVPGNYNFKVVIKNYPSLEIAQQRYQKLTEYGHKLILYSKDSVYKIAMPFTTPLSDTARARDSVRRYLFKGNPYVELN